MNKIILSKEVLNKHKQYFKSNILQNVNESENVEFCEDDITKEIYKNQHLKFVKFINRNCEKFAIGNISQLYYLYKQVKVLMPHIEKMYETKIIDKGKYEYITYNEYLYNLFSYEKFKVKDFFYYLNKKAQKNVKKNRFCTKVQEEIIDILVENYPNKRKEIKKKLAPNGYTFDVDKFKKELKKLADINITMDNFKQIDIFSEEWNDYVFVMESNLRVCPYCNRQYITPIYSDNGRMRADIDHFLPKSIYPYFSMSLYNLVPVCKFCNQSLKRDREFGFSSVNPYDENLSDYFKFKVNYFNNEISIEKDYSKNKDITYHINTFKLEGVYNYHRNQAEELIKKRIAYPDNYIKKLYNDNKDYFKDEDEVKQLIIGYISDKDKLNNEAFSKLRLDIAEQLGFINRKQDKEIIKKLKNKKIKI